MEVGLSGAAPVTKARVDEKTGVEESLLHVPTRRGRIYAWTALPQDARSGVVVCSSIFGDFTANYHRERLLGLALASRGFGVIRFHYIGEGNSDGERVDMTFSSLCEDTRTMLDHARSMGLTRLAVVGSRVSAPVAANSSPGLPLVLWEPVIQPLRFINEAHTPTTAQPGPGKRNCSKRAYSTCSDTIFTRRLLRALVP
ncbi:MAG: hypothetical protein LC739_06415 [Actinobacteria bacterium]|nr:hypothetical protein [Actinomycetota bacterium]